MYLQIWIVCFSCFTVTIAQDLNHELRLDDANDFNLRWTYVEDYIEFEVSAKTTGWLAFGLSPKGGMDQADVMFGFVDPATGRGNVTDRYLRADGTNVVLQMDTQQDWQLLSAVKNNTHTTLRVRRKLVTCDAMDHPITKDTTKIIFSLNHQPPQDYIRPALHDFRSKRSVLLLDDLLATRKMGLPVRTPATMDWNVLMDGIKIPDTESSRYQCSIIPIPKFTKKYHILKFEPKIEQANVDIVHHILVYLCDKSITDAFQPKNFRCGLDNPLDPNFAAQNALMFNCSTVIYAWAVGGSPFTYPDEAGYPIGPEQSGQFVFMEMHYNNALLQNRTDSSGVKFLMTDRLRKYDAGLLTLGSASFDVTMLIPPKTDSFSHYGVCAEECTRAGLPEDGVTVFAGFLHSHYLGRKIVMRHIQKGIEVPVLAQDNAFDFNFQEGRAVVPARKFMKGDQLVLQCDYSTSNPPKLSVTTGGLNTTNEMCFATLAYYPMANLSSCFSIYKLDTSINALGFQDLLTDHRTQNLNSTGNYSFLENVMEVQSVREPLMQRLSTVNWTSETVQALQKAYQTADQYSFCGLNKNGFLYSEISIPQLAPQKPEASTCPVIINGHDHIISPAEQSKLGNAQQLKNPTSSGNSVMKRSGTIPLFVMLCVPFRWFLLFR